MASQACGGSRIRFHSGRATGFGSAFWPVVALIPSPSPGGSREHLAGGLRFYRDRWWSGWNAVEAGGVASQACGGSRIPFHFVRATGFGSAFGSWWPSSPALLPEGEGSTWPVGSGFVETGGGPDGTRWNPGAWRHKLTGDPGFGFTPAGLRVFGSVFGSWWPSSPALLPEGEGSTWPVGSGFIEAGGRPDGTRWRPGAWRHKLAAGSRIPFHFVRATGFGSAFGSWWPSFPALLPEGEGGTWLVGSGFIETSGSPDGTRWRPGAWRYKLAGDPGFRFTPSGLRALDPCLARGGPHPRPFSRREKGVLGRWAQVLSRPVVARMERGGGRGRGVTSLRGIPDSVSLHPGYGSCGFWVRVWPVVALIPSPSPAREGRTWMRIGSAHGCAHPGHGRDTFILTGFLLFPRFRAPWAVSSAVEHCLHTAGVTGSIPVPPTKIIRCF